MVWTNYTCGSLLRVAKWQLVSRHFVGAMLTLSDIDIVQDIAACLRKSTYFFLFMAVGAVLVF